MATETDVYTALMALIKGTCYPNGVMQDSIITVPVNVISGWPNPLRLGADSVVVSVYKVPGLEKPTICFDSNWETVQVTLSTLFMTATASTVTITGEVTVPQSCFIKVNQVPYYYQTLSTDNGQTIAAAFAAMIPNATSNANVITIENAYQLLAAVGVTGTAVREVMRTEASFYITVWSSNDAYRQTIANAILVSFANAKRLALPYGRNERLKYHSRRDDDKSQKTGVYRTDLIFAIEYGLTDVKTFYTITNTQLNLSSVPSIS